MLLQLRTFAVAGRPKVLGHIFVVLDVLVIMILVAMAVLEAKGVSMNVTVYFPVDFTNDPFVWMTLAPLEFCALVANLALVWRAYFRRKREYGQVPKLMKIVLRDNICYLVG